MSSGQKQIGRKPGSAHVPGQRAGGAEAPAGWFGRIVNPPVSDWITLAVRVGLALVWGWAGAAKISDPEAAAQAVRAYRLLPEALVKPVGYGLPFLELAIALLLVVGLGVRIVAGISAALLLVYIGGIASVWARGISIDCGCFGGGGAVAASQTMYWQEILRDLGFLALSAWLLWRPAGTFSLDRWLAAD